MVHTLLLVLGTVGCLFVFSNLSIVSAKSVVITPHKENDEESNAFFEHLSAYEQQWIMHLACLFYDADDSQIALPVDPIDAKPLRALKPLVNFYPVLPSTNMPDQPPVPERLIAQFLNGDVPKDWQKNFKLWLAKTFQLQTKNFEQYRKSGVFCHKTDPCNLHNLTNIGGQCCPFG